MNFAVHGRRGGEYAAYLGAIGTDDGDLIRSSLHAEGIELERLPVEEGPNAFAAVHMDDGANRVWGLCEKGVSLFRLDNADLEYFAGFDLVHTGEISRLDDQLAEVRDRVAISFDFSDRDLEYAAGVLPYLKAAAFSRGNTSDDEVASEFVAAQSSGVELVTITQGSRGATVSHRGENLFAPSVPVDAVDTLGARDAFVSRLAYRVLTGVPLAQAASDPAQHSALLCGTRGAFGHARTTTREIPS